MHDTIETTFFIYAARMFQKISGTSGKNISICDVGMAGWK